MQGIVQGIVSQTMKLDPIERARRWKRSLDGYISFRKACLIALFVFGFILYIGPSIFSWLFGTRPHPIEVHSSCINDRVSLFTSDLSQMNAHSLHQPWRPTLDRNYLPYVGNGHFGLSIADYESKFHIVGRWTINTTVNFKPVVQVTADTSTERESATVVQYPTGVVHNHRCMYTNNDDFMTVSQQFLAHRVIKEVLVQEIKIMNPTGRDESFTVQRLGISGWEGATSREHSLQHGDGNHDYTITTGLVPVPVLGGHSLVAVVTQKLPPAIQVGARMTHKLDVVTAIAYSKPGSKSEVRRKRETIEEQAIAAVTKAVGMTPSALRIRHEEVWRNLWTTGFGISHSLADDAINGHQINATIYYVLSQVPTPLHALDVDPKERGQLGEYLAYLEGCYGGHSTLQATNLWKSLSTLDDVNTVVRFWLLTLEKNGCHHLIKAGADGVIQSMVLSFGGFKFHRDHLEMNSNPKDLHRDLHFRRINYGNATHVNVSIEVQDDNKAAIFIALDRRNKDYFACDAGCLDPPVKLSTEATRFPVKLTDPVTAILYITSDHQHMEELKHAIHVKEVVDAPAHEHHVIALHKHGNKLGGLPAIFWFSIGFLIFVFHVFLFKLIWQEYCASQDKFRTSKHV